MLNALAVHGYRSLRDLVVPLQDLNLVTGPNGSGKSNLYRAHGLLRPLKAAELSDGTLRYLLWVSALLTPRPPGLLVLNEPETSLHPDLLPALGRLIALAATRSQVIVVSHAPPLIDALQQLPECHSITLAKAYGETGIVEELEQP